MIERKNIIKLIGDRTNVYHSALLTTYSFDPIFFESVCISTLRKLGITNVVVLMDAGMYDQLLDDSNYHCHNVSQLNYTLVRQENTHSGVFHPKIVLLFGEEEGLLIVGSGNLTYSGLLYNDEVWNAFHIQGADSVHFPLFYQAWVYLSHTTNHAASLVLRQIEWMKEQSPWLHKECNEDTVQLSFGEECSFIYNTEEQTILERLFSVVDKKKIVDIKVVAPFYDTDGYVLLELKKHFLPQRMCCILDLERQSAPYTLLNTANSIIFYKAETTNPLHAKIIELQAENETWLLCGSANAGNKALGTNRFVFNDEACILLHCDYKRYYIEELGIKYSVLSHEEKNSIVPIKKKKVQTNGLNVRFLSCEEQNDNLILQFSKAGINGTLTLLDNLQNVIGGLDITTGSNIVLSLENTLLSKLHIAVLKKNNIEISNRLIVVREVCVERGNPDPKRRKLSRFLDNPDLSNNLSHILGYIEFDDSEKKSKSATAIENTKSKNDENDIVVLREGFYNLKNSSLNISMHPGVRILTYLQQILFRDDDVEQTDDDLLVIGENGFEGENEKERCRSNKISDVVKIRDEVFYFLKKMLVFLKEKTIDKSIYGRVNPAVNKPVLMAEPGLNASSSLAVAARVVIFLMNKYASSVRKSGEVKELFIKCAGYFLSLYANNIPDGDSMRNRKIRELLIDASINVLSALCFFGYDKKNCAMPQLVLNIFELWNGQEEMEEIMPLFESQIVKLNADALNSNSVMRIRAIAAKYLSQETPIEEFSLEYESFYQLRKGFGFLIVDNLKRTSNGWSYACHAPWFDDIIDNTTATKFKGYYGL